MTLKLYFDLISQPSRAIYIMLKKSKCPFTPHFVDIRKGKNQTGDFHKINRFKKVPVIDHNGFILTESVAIMRYLARENKISESLFPKESKALAKIDEFLAWQHTGLRMPCTMFFRIAYLEPMLSDMVPDHYTVLPYMRRVEETLDTFDTMWLGQGSPFIVGETPTVADLVAACELEQIRMAEYEIPPTFANISTWKEKVMNYFNPYYQDGHAVVHDIIASQERVGPIAF